MRVFALLLLGCHAQSQSHVDVAAPLPAPAIAIASCPADQHRSHERCCPDGTDDENGTCVFLDDAETIVACEKGLVHACGRAGASKLNEPYPHVEAERLFTKGCSGGHLLSCAMLGQLALSTDPALATDAPPSEDDIADAKLRCARAMPFLERACAGSEPVGCWMLARNISGPCGNDLARAHVLRVRSCEANYAMACFDLGLDESDRKMFERACELDDARGCLWAGWDTAKTDPAHALSLQERGCNLKNNACCRAAGELLQKTDPARAKTFFDQACRLSHSVLDCRQR